MRYKVIAAALLIFILHGCKKTEDIVCPKCAADVVCTTEFRYYTVSVRDEANLPVRLSRYETVNLSNGKALYRDITTEEITLGHTTGFYPLVDDRNLDEVSTCNQEYEFRGYAGNERLITRKFTLRDDCCHVDLVSGNQFITYP